MMDGHGADHRPDTKNQCDITDIGTNYVTECDIALWRIQQVSLQTYEEFWGTRSEGNDGKSDYEGANLCAQDSTRMGQLKGAYLRDVNVA